jgi:hypothetical protein
VVNKLARAIRAALARYKLNELYDVDAPTAEQT